MRERMLRASVIRVLGDEEKPREVVHMWAPHRLSLAYAAAAGFAMFALAWVLQVSTVGGRVALGFAAASIAAIATNDYRVLARTNRGLVLLRSSRIRQRATAIETRLARDASIEPVGENLVITDWMVAGRRYHVMKRFQRAMSSMSEA